LALSNLLYLNSFILHSLFILRYSFCIHPMLNTVQLRAPEEKRALPCSAARPGSALKCGRLNRHDLAVAGIEQIEALAEGRRIAWNLESIRLLMRVEEMAVL